MYKNLKCIYIHKARKQIGETVLLPCHIWVSFPGEKLFQFVQYKLAGVLFPSKPKLFETLVDSKYSVIYSVKHVYSSTCVHNY